MASPRTASLLNLSGIATTVKSSQLCGPTGSLSSVDIKITGNSGFLIWKWSEISKVRSCYSLLYFSVSSISSLLWDSRTSCSDKYQLWHHMLANNAYPRFGFGTFMLKADFMTKSSL
jgi:hypothetical protein